MALNLEVNILGEFRNLTKATKGATKQLQSFQKSANGISRGINAAFAAIGVGLSFNALKNSIKSVVTQASSLEQSIGATEIIFGEFSDVIIQKSKEAAQAFGISANDYLTSANLINAQLKGYGLSAIEAAGQTQTLVERAADMAATFGGTTLDAVNALSAVFRGEFNQIEKYAVTLRKSDITARIAQKGYAGLTGEALKQQEAIAGLELIMERTQQTQGQNAREANTLQGAMARVTASFANASASIGQGFAPAVSGIATFINQNIGVFTDLADAIGEKLRSAFETTGGAADTFGQKIITTLTDLTDFLNGTATAGNQFAQLSTKFEPLLDVFDALGVFGKGLLEVLDGLAVGLFGWLSVFNGGQPVVNGFADVLRVIGNLLQEFGRGLGIIGSLFIPLTGTLKAVGIAIQGLLSPLKTLGSLFSKSGPIIGGLKSMGERAKLAFTTFKNSANGVKPSLSDLTKATKTTADAIAGNFRTGVGAAIDDAKGKLDTFARSLDAQDSRRIRNYIDVITTSYNGNTDLIPASNTNDPDSRFPENPRPGQVYTWYNYSDRKNPNVAIWWTQTWTGSEWTKPKRMTYTPAGSTSTGGAGQQTQTEDPEVTLFKKKVTNIVDKLRDALEDSRRRISDSARNFRDSVQLSFGVITNGAFATFDVNRIIRQMQRIKDAASTFADDIRALQEQGADTALIDQLLGMDPISGSTAARGLLSSGRLDEFLALRGDLEGIGTGAAQAANQNLYGGSTSELAQSIQKLSRVIERGAGNTYNINMANTSKLTAKEIIDAIKSYEKTSGKKVFSN